MEQKKVLLNSTLDLSKNIVEHKWYQDYWLNENFHTKGEQGEDSFRKLELLDLPKTFEGKQVLDIGCAEGFFSFQLEKLHANVVGIDSNPKRIDVCNRIKTLVDSSVKFHNQSIYDIQNSRIYSRVFLISVFQHLRYPLLALERIAQITKESLVIWTPVLYENTIDQHLIDNDLQQPLAVLKENDKNILRWLFNIKFIIDLLEYVGFKKIIVKRMLKKEWDKEYKYPILNNRKISLKIAIIEAFV